ncbi:MAG: hypothetical protein GY721_05330 [Deltaproteobacteria bacterium]|nr:hypothetical protein [Deltaproteobacteria bacterium]
MKEEFGGIAAGKALTKGWYRVRRSTAKVHCFYKKPGEVLRSSPEVTPLT